MKKISINKRTISPGNPAYIIAEMSANHNQDFDRAVKLLEAAKNTGADAVKLQTYTPDTMTLDSDLDWFRIKDTIWKGQTLYQLYKEACTPWEWQPKLKKIADKLGLDLFSTPFDNSAVEFLEKMEVPAYKIASFELVDTPLLKRVAQTGKPVILSTGMASLEEIRFAVNTLKEHNCRQIALLKCTSAYPAPPEEANLKTMVHLSETFDLVSGLSDHTLGTAVAVAAVAMGGSIVEKHLCLSRDDAGPDAPFSMEPNEFARMVKDIRTTQKAMGEITYEPTKSQVETLSFRRSLFVVENIKKGAPITQKNIRSIRPGAGLAPRHLPGILGKKAKKNLTKGTPLSWDLLDQ